MLRGRWPGIRWCIGEDWRGPIDRVLYYHSIFFDADDSSGIVRSCSMQSTIRDNGQGLKGVQAVFTSCGQSWSCPHLISHVFHLET